MNAGTKVVALFFFFFVSLKSILTEPFFILVFHIIFRTLFVGLSTSHSESNICQWQCGRGGSD